MDVAAQARPEGFAGVRLGFRFSTGKAFGDTHKLEAILLSLTPFVFDRFLPSLTLWLSPNFPPRYARILAYGLPCPTLGRHPGAGPSLGGDVHDRRWLSINLFLPMAKTTRTSSRQSSSSSGAEVPPRLIWPRFG